MLIWEDLTRLEKLAIRELSKQDFDTFVKIWFPIQQGKSGFLTGITFTLHAPLMKLFRGQERHHFRNAVAVKLNCFRSIFRRIHTNLTRETLIFRLLTLSLNEIASVAICLILQSGKNYGLQKLVRHAMMNFRFTRQENTPKSVNLWAVRSLARAVVTLHHLFRLRYARSRKARRYVFEGTARSNDSEEHNSITSRALRDADYRYSAETTCTGHDRFLNGGMGIEFDRISIPAMVTREYGESLPDWLRPHLNVLSSSVIIGIYFSFWPRKAFTILSLCVRLTYIHFFLSISRSRSHLAVMLSTWSSSITEPEKSDTQARSFLHGYNGHRSERRVKRLLCLLLGLSRKGVFYRCTRQVGSPSAGDSIQSVCFSMLESGMRNTKKNIRRGSERYRFDSELPQGVSDRNYAVAARQGNMHGCAASNNGYVILPESHHMLNEFLAEAAAFTYDDSHPHDDIMDNLLMWLTSKSTSQTTLLIEGNGLLDERSVNVSNQRLEYSGLLLEK
ncbi:terminase small subunit [Salmonella virus STSR3]|nr:terminase small subunit [Salmonella virus STSR3]